MIKRFLVCLSGAFFSAQIANSATLKVSIEGSEISSLLTQVVSLTNCSLAQFMRSAKPSENSAGAAKTWDLQLGDMKFQNGLDITLDDIESSLRQANFLDRQMIESITYKKNFSKITFKLPVDRPEFFLTWLIKGNRLSAQCGHWKFQLVSKNQITLSKGKQNIQIWVENRKLGLSRIKSGDVDVFIPLNWLDIEPFLRTNPGVKTLSSQEGRSLYFYLNPRRISDLSTRLEILRKVRQTVLPFPFIKNDTGEEKLKLNAKGWESEFVVGSPVQVEWLFAAKHALASLFSIVRSPRIKVLDLESLYAEIKAGDLGAWISDKEGEVVFFHSDLAPATLGKSAWSKAGLDSLIERSLLKDGEVARDQVLSILENEGILTTMTSLKTVALVRPDLANKKITNQFQLKFLEELF
jgi:hypothetical protein